MDCANFCFTPPSLSPLHSRRVLRSCEETPEGSAPVSRRRRKKPRVAINPENYRKLKDISRHKFHTKTSSVGDVVLSTYLDEMERIYFGRPKASALPVIPADQRPYDAVLFDMDGVLCDSEHLSRDAAVRMFERHYNLKVKPEDFSPFTGTGEARFLAGVAGVYGLEDFDAEKAKSLFFDTYLHEGYVHTLKPFTGASKLVEGVKRLGLKVAVASSADRIKVDANLSAIGLPAEQFDFITSGDLITRKKPFPDIFLTTARNLKVEPARCVVVEDAVAGVEAACAAGMRCVAVATSMPETALAAANAAVVRANVASISWDDIFGQDIFSQEEEEEASRAVEEESL